MRAGAMRSAEHALDNMDEAVTHYIDSHHSQVELEELGAADDARLGLAPPAYVAPPARPAWGEELLEGGLAALVAQLGRPRALPPLHELRPGAWEPARACRRSLPHKKRLSRKLEAPRPRAPLVCRECGLGCGDDQLRFYRHLKRHYEPHLAPEPEPCLADAAALPDSIVELTLDAPAKQYAPPAKAEECGEFSEPEDLMAGIHVCVEAAAYDAPALPHLTVDAGHVSQDHRDTHWLARDCCGGSCDRAPLNNLKEEVLQRILAGADEGAPPFPDDMLAERHHRLHDAHTLHDHHGLHDDHHALHEAADDHVLHEHAAEHALHEHTGGHALHDAADEHVLHEHGDEHALHENALSEPADVHVTQSHVVPHARDDSLAAPAPPADPPPAPPDGHADTKRQWRCSRCARVFLHRNSLLYHALSHGSRQHACEHCHKAFYTLTALKVHSRVHSGDRPYKCTACDKQFRQWSDLNYHNSSLHSDKKRFKCEYCGKQFARKYSLSVHERIHTGERNYKCHYCTKTFRASSYRLAHMRTHTGDRPYKCGECDKPFRSAFDLRRHSLVHDKLRAGARPRRAAAPAQESAAPAQEHAAPAERPTKRVAVASTSLGHAAPARSRRRALAPPPPALNESGFIERLTALYNVPPA